MTRIALDAMGGDHAPGEIVVGAVESVAGIPDVKILLVGQLAPIQAELDKLPRDLKCAAQKAMEYGFMIMPGSPVAEPLFEGDKVVGVRMADQGVDKKGAPQEGVYMPGMDIKAALTVVADGPVGAVGRALDEKFGLPPGHHRNDWGVGMKAVVQLPESCTL